MGITRDDNTVEIDGTQVRIVGRSGVAKAQWQMFEGSTLLDEHEAMRGTFELTGRLSTGTEVTATVEQSLFGPTKVTVRTGEEVRPTFDGLVV